jgi:hypothetical protein
MSNTSFNQLSRAAGVIWFAGPALLLIAALFTQACAHSSSDGQAQAPAEPASAQPAAGPDLAHHMQASFWAAVEARDAVINGDLTLARKRTGELSQQRFEQLPARWKHWIAQMQKSAGDAAIAGSMQETAQGVASLALTCGDCHGYSGEGPKWGVQHGPEATTEPESLQARMLRHAHAADDLWMGLVMPSDAAWTRGARKLNEAPPERPLAQGEEINAHFAEKLNQIKALGLRATTAGTPQQRAEVYGDLIARCADCHAVVAR